MSDELITTTHTHTHTRACAHAAGASSTYDVQQIISHARPLAFAITALVLHCIALRHTVAVLYLIIQPELDRDDPQE
eukprot:COSAG05_NODE_965_length_6403_cov_50.682741_5_plen_77_part_00